MCGRTVQHALVYMCVCVCLWCVRIAVALKYLHFSRFAHRFALANFSLTHFIYIHYSLFFPFILGQLFAFSANRRLTLYICTYIHIYVHISTWLALLLTHMCPTAISALLGLTYHILLHKL